MNTVFIRFNPDSYKTEKGKIPSCFTVKKDSGKVEIRNKKEWEGRLSKLKEMILNHKNQIPEKSITIEYMFYDEIDE